MSINRFKSTALGAMVGLAHTRFNSFLQIFICVSLNFISTIVGLSQAFGETNSLELDGVLTYAVLKQGKIVYHAKRTFSIQTDFRGWRIQAMTAPGSNWVLPGSLPASPVATGSEYTGMITNSATSDGTNLFLNAIYDAKAMSHRSTKSATENLDILSVKGEPVPPFSADLIFPIWLAYASTGYLQRHSAQRIPPIIEMVVKYSASTNLNYRYEFEVKREGRYLFPSQIDFYRYRTNGTSYLKAAYRVELWKTENGIEYPSRSTLQCYTSGVPDGSNGMRFSLTCNSAKLVFCGFRGSPEVRSGNYAQVTDHRVDVHGKPVRYMTSNAIVSPQSSNMLRLVKNQEIMTEHFRKKISERNTVFGREFLCIILGAFVIFPLVLLLYKTYMKRRVK